MPEKLCCTLNNYIYCFHCKKQWCETCWEALFPSNRIWKESNCPHYPDAPLGDRDTVWQGNHYTMSPGDKDPTPDHLAKHDIDVADGWASWKKNTPWERPSNDC